MRVDRGLLGIGNRIALIDPVGAVLDAEHATASQLILPVTDQSNRLGAFGLSDNCIGFAHGNIHELRLLGHLGAAVDLNRAWPVSDQEAFTPFLLRTRNS